MAKATARASGLNRKPPMPGIRPSGASTIIVVQVATRTGTMTSIEPSRAARRRDLPIVPWRWMFSRATMASSTSGPMARARPPSVMALMVLPVTYKPMTAPRMASGIDVLAMTVMRQLPRNNRIMSDTRAAPIAPSWTRLQMASRT